MNLNISAPDSKTLAAEANSTLEVVAALVIDSPAMYEVAAEELKEIKTKYKNLEERRKAITGPLDKAKKEVMDLFRAPLATLEKAESSLKNAILVYSDNLRRQAAQEQADLDRAARLEAERLKEEAVKAEAEGHVERAAVLQNTAQVITAPVAQAEPAKVTGLATRAVWKAEVFDKGALIQHVAANPDLIDLLVVDQKSLDAMARALKANMKFPGVRAVSTESLAVRG